MKELPIRGVLAVTATYVYFLLYAQFGFLKLLADRGVSEVEAVMAAMGVAGLAASLATGRLLAAVPARILVRAAFLGCAATALGSLLFTGVVALAGVAALIGVSVGVLTVALAADLRALISGRHFALGVGLGTGLAYFLCNLPPLFEAPPAVHGVAVALASIAGLAAVRPRRAGAGGADTELVPERPALARGDYLGWGFASVVVSFLGLIWLDSAAFAVIQETADLKGLTWGSGGQKLVIGAVHLLAAVAGGRLIDRGRFRSLLLAAFVLFGVAFALLDRGGAATLAGPIYAVGISLYSVALVVYPAYGPQRPGLVPRRWRAALIYGVGGWLGSALGVGMAQNLHRVPGWFVGITGVVLAGSWALARSGHRLKSLARVYGTTAGWGVAGLLLYALTPGGTTGAATAVERGRRVYVREGCIHCHSQYVRPRSRDVELWGPHRDPAAAEPPLYGNRRQGPDLANVGTRRSSAWQRLHLIDPRALTPGSRMPSYAHLFRDGGSSAEASPGEDLVAYLDSLGAAVRQARFDATLAYRPPDVAGSADCGGRLFRTDCAPCHGLQGRGDGPLAAEIYRPAMNLRKGRFWLVSWGPGAEPEEQALARLIKFGVPGTDMPGHETLAAAEIADLVAYVRGLPADGPTVADAGDDAMPKLTRFSQTDESATSLGRRGLWLSPFAKGGVGGGFSGVGGAEAQASVMGVARPKESPLSPPFFKGGKRSPLPPPGLDSSVHMSKTLDGLEALSLSGGR